MKTEEQNPNETFSFLTMLKHLHVEEMMEQVDNSAILQIVAQLPQANRDTLAFLVLHLHKYAPCWSG